MKRNLSKLLPLFVMAMFSFAKSAQASEIYHSVQNGASEGEVIAYAGGYTKVSSLSFLDIYLGDGAANWTAKNILSEESFVGQDGVSYSTAFVQGGTNGMKGHLIHGNGMSAHVKLVPSGDGTVYIAAKYGATKPIWAAKVPNNSVSSLNMADMTPYLIPGFSEAIATDTGIVMTKAMYINDAGTGLQESTASADTYATLPLQVEAGYTYYFWASGSKIMLCGINANEISAPTPTSYPTSTDLVGYYTPGQLCVAIYFRGQVCNDVIFVGTYNNWSTTPTECAKFQPVVGFDGWYVVAVTDNSSNIEGKPVQLANDGSFSWLYQTGDADSWTLVSGYVSIGEGYSGESNLTNYDTSTPVILISDYFKNHNSPCGDVRHTYTVNLKAPVCGNFTPAIIGDFNQWATGIAMTYDAATGTYSHSFTGNEGESFKFLACGYDDWSNELLIYQDGSWIPNPDITLTDQLTYTLDYSEGKYALCEEETYIFTYDIVNGEAILTGYNGTLSESVEIPATITIGNTLYDVTSIGERAFASCSSLTSIILPNSVTSIGYEAFYNCSSLTSITLPNSVTSIGEEAFQYCSSLTSITLPNSVTSIGDGVFNGCSSLTSIVVESGNTMYDSRENCNAIIETATNTLIVGCQSTIIPNSVTSIGYEAFYDCSSLTSITIPNSVTSIGRAAFAYCYSLTSITIPNSVTSIGDYAFSEVPNIVYSGTATGSPWGASSVNGYVDGYLVYADETKTNLLACSAAATGEITIPNSVTTIGDAAFRGCSSLTSIILPNSVTSIGNYAFYGCTSLPVEDNLRYADTYLVEAVDKSLSTYTIKTGTKWIGDDAFSYCSSLTSIILPNSVTGIGGNAFSYCSSLTSITIPNSVTSIGWSAFHDCYSLTSIILPNSVTSIGEWAFAECDALTSITLPNSVTSIGSCAFAECDALTSITLGNSVTSIGDWAFSGCSALTSITLPNSVTSIGRSAFGGCSSLTSITLPNSVTSIGDYAFSYCSSLTSVTIGNSVTSIGENAFYDCSSLTSVTIGNSVTSIGSSAFNGCYSLTSVTIPNSVTSIGENAFYDCSSLTSVTIGNSVTSIGSSAFNGCYSLTSVTIPNSVTSIGNDAFQNCKGLTEFTIPENITYLGDGVFEGCSGITSITWNAKRCQDRWKDLYYYSQLPFYDIYSQISSFTFGETVDSIPSFLCYEMSNLSSITIPENVKHIGGSVFSNCTGLTSVAWNAINCSNDVGDGSGSIWPIFTYSNAHITSFTLGEKVEVIPGALCYGLSELTSITIPSSVKTIGSHAFRDCSGLTAIGIPENVTSIEYSTFSGCTALASVIIPSSVTMIDEYAFGECLKLRDVYCYPATPPTAQINSFANYDVYVHVPCASLDAYDMDVVFGSFKYLECIGAEDTVITDKTVTVVPGDADATFTWPVTDNAETYSLVIAKDGVTFCTLVFNAQGQLLSIAFKPRRQNALAAEGITPATYAEMTANGFRFTVTGLDEGTAYAYTLTVRNAANTVLETYTGDFTTLSNTPTGINESAGEDAHAAGQVEKIIRDGQVLILRNGVTYDMMGNML